MSIERNCPIDTYNADLVPRCSNKESLVFRRGDIDKLLSALSEECKLWKKSDGEIWRDSPESWLRKQLNLQKGMKPNSSQHIGYPLARIMKRGFHQMSRTWYKDSALRNKEYTESILFGMYRKHEGTDGEMSMRWYNQCNSARLEVFEDGFKQLYEFKNVLKCLSEFNNQIVQPEEFVEILKECGFEDLTETRRENGTG